MPVPGRVVLRPGRLPLLLLPAAGVLMPPLLLLVPPEQVEGGTPGVLWFWLTSAVLCIAIALAGRLRRGREALVADASGLHLVHRGRAQRLRWEEVRELGWVVPGRYAPGGLAGRLVTGSPYDVPGPSTAGWLCQPSGRLLPREALADLRSLCEAHGVAWRDYASAEVM